MSALIAVVETRVAEPLLSPAVSRELAIFLAGGNTGRFVLNIKSGEIRTYEVVKLGDARASLDETLIALPQSDH